MSVGLVKIRNNRYYLTISDQSYVELLRRIRIIPDFNTKTPPPRLNAKNKALAKMYYLVPGNKVNWASVRYDRNVRYGLWCAWREWVNIDKLNEFTHAGEIYNDSKQNLTKAIYSEKTRGLGEAVEGIVFAIKNRRQLEYNDCDELRKNVKHVLKTYLPKEMEMLKQFDPDYRDTLVIGDTNNEAGIDRLVDDFVRFWTTKPNREDSYMIQRYNEAKFETFIRGKKTNSGKLIGGIMHDFGYRFKGSRLGVIIGNSPEGDDIPQEEPLSFIEKIDLDNTFDSIKLAIQNDELTRRQNIILCLLIYYQYYDSESRENSKDKFINFLHQINERGQRATILDEIKSIEVFIGRKIWELYKPEGDDTKEVIIREIARQFCRVDNYIDRLSEICPDKIEQYLDEAGI